MSMGVTLIVLALMGLFGNSIQTPICSIDDRRYSPEFRLAEECDVRN